MSKRNLTYGGCGISLGDHSASGRRSIGMRRRSSRTNCASVPGYVLREFPYSHYDQGGLLFNSVLRRARLAFVKTRPTPRWN